MAEFTTGPWKNNCFRVVAPGVPGGMYGGREVCDTGQGRGSSEECEANAILIAQAPSLLEACEALLHLAAETYDVSDEEFNGHPAVIMAKSTVSAAKGSGNGEVR